ncbi:MAG: hypothetical protein ACLFRX_04955 [Gemmatimonadota bacterium]
MERAREARRSGAASGWAEGRAPRFGLALAAALGLAGCDGGTDPSVAYDPELTLEQLDDVVLSLDVGQDLLLGLDLAVATLDYYGSYALADAVATRPERHESLLRTLRPRRSLPMGATLTSPAHGADGRDASFHGEVGPAALSLPSSYVGRVLTWDPTEGYLVSGRSGAPARGTRFVVYRMDAASGYPSEPLVEVGYLDLVDADGGVTEGVRVVMTRTTGPGRVVADYTVSLGGSGSADQGMMEVTTRGSIGEGHVVELDLEERLSWSRAADWDELTLDYSYHRGGQAVTLRGRAESRYQALEWETFAFEMGFFGYGPTVELTAEIRSDDRVDGEIAREGRRAIRIGGTDSQPTFDQADGRALSASGRWTLEQVWTAIGDLIWLTDWIVSPADLLVLDG